MRSHPAQLYRESAVASKRSIAQRAKSKTSGFKSEPKASDMSGGSGGDWVPTRTGAGAKSCNDAAERLRTKRLVERSEVMQ